MDYQRTIAAESGRFLSAITQADLDARVPTCPEWTVGDLFWHLTEVHAYWAAILRTGALSDAESEAAEALAPARPETAAAVASAFETHTEALLDQLSAHPDDLEPAWFWLETAKTVGSTRRMQAHEATMHRVDAETAAGLPLSPIDPELAADGVEHAFNTMWAWWGTLPGFGFHPVGGEVELEATDLGRSWWVQPGRWRGTGQSGKEYDQPGAVLVEAGAGLAQVRGTAAELYRWLWGRGAEPATSGDVETLAALREAQAAGMQ